MHTVHITVNQIAGLDFQPADFHRRAKFNNVNVGVRDGNVAGKKLKTQFLRSGQIAHRAIRHRARAAERAKNVDMHRAQQGSKTNFGGHVLNHDHAWRGQRENIIPPIRSVGIVLGGRGRGRTANLDSRSIADQRRELREEAMDGVVDKAFIAQPGMKRFDGVGQGTGVQAAENVQFVRKLKWHS